ncbi:hypothetical protein [Nonomuraea basaltis]|uniref:hypothetical protein n=1 Tax=Nonomuraea basaltis TaxID=2495887 RepID=UPI00110C518E|nr:hypothetical protein [Nonomuraea basaltis]TMR91438.1 hypothetical protein EJK15_49935 [Nonomuraea basaltis]
MRLHSVVRPNVKVAHKLVLDLIEVDGPACAVDVLLLDVEHGVPVPEVGCGARLFLGGAVEHRDQRAAPALG